VIAPETAPNSEAENSPQTLIDINTCSQEDLENLKGIGPETAENIIRGRPYGKIDDLDRVEDIGPKTLEEIRPFLTVSLIEHVNIPNLVTPREGATTPERDTSDVGVNVNTCTLEELLAVPKVGARLVARIIDGRPYGRARDLLRVEGISESKLEVIRPYLTVGPDRAWRSVDEPPPSPPKKPKPPKPEQVKTSEAVPPAGKPEETAPETKTAPAAAATGQAQTDSAEVLEEPLPGETPSESKTDREDRQKVVYIEKRPGPSQASVWLMGILAVILAILLTLGIIWLINGSLRHATLDDLNQKIETLTLDTETLQTNMADLQTTNTDLEERVVALEEELSTANEELTETTELAESLQALVDKDADLQEQIDALEERVTALEETVADLEEQLMALQTAGGTFEAPRPNE
jgi:competence protein ComEA